MVGADYTDNEMTCAQLGLNKRVWRGGACGFFVHLCLVPTTEESSTTGVLILQQRKRVHQIRWRKIKIDSIIAYRFCFIIAVDHECSKLGRQRKFKVYKFN